MLDALKHIREAAERLENAIERCPEGTKRHAELALAWHHLMQGYCLIQTGELTPDKICWGSQKVKEILAKRGS